MLKKPIVNTVVQVMGKAITVLISLVTTGILTRKLGPDVYGSFTLISSVFLILDSLADFGTKIIGVREASLLEGKEQKKIFTRVAFIRLGISLVAFLIGLGLIFNLKGFETIRLESIVSLSMIFLTSIGGSLEVVFQTKLRMDLKVSMDVLYPLFFLILLITWNNPIGLMWVFVGYLVARFISIVWGLVLTRNDFESYKSSSINLEFAKKFLKEAWPMGLYLIIFSGYDRLVDSLLIQKYIGLTELAYYGLAYKIYGNLIQPAYFFVNSIFPIMSLKTTERKKLFGQSTLLIALGLIILLPTVYFLAPWIIGILGGSGFEASVVVLRILLIALVFSYFGHLVGFTLIARGGQRQILQSSLISLSLNILGNLWAIPRFGIIGAAVVTVGTEAINCFVMSVKLARNK
jgi:O-antigen/teichoic acid export membrane protein